MPRLFDFYMLLAFRCWSRSQPELAEEYMTLAWQCVHTNLKVAEPSKHCLGETAKL